MFTKGKKIRKEMRKSSLLQLVEEAELASPTSLLVPVFEFPVLFKID